MTASRTIRSLLVAVGGGLLVGCLLWQAYHLWRPVTDNAIAAVVNTTNALALASALGSVGRATLLLLGVIMILRSLTGGLILGLAVGLLLPRVRYKRLMCYAVLGWPALMWVWLSLRARGMLGADGVDQAIRMWHRRGDYMLEAFYIYGVFFALLALVLFVVKQYAHVRQQEAASAPPA